VAEPTAPADPGPEPGRTPEGYRSGQGTLEDLLRQLPPETDRSYELHLAEIALNADRERL